MNKIGFDIIVKIRISYEAGIILNERNARRWLNPHLQKK